MQIMSCVFRSVLLGGICRLIRSGVTGYKAECVLHSLLMHKFLQLVFVHLTVAFEVLGDRSRRLKDMGERAFVTTSS